MRYTYRKPYVPLDERRVGVKCDECSLEVDDPAGNLPCPNCGSTLRRLPRGWGQAVADTIDVSENPAYGPGHPDWEHDRDREDRP